MTPAYTALRVVPEQVRALYPNPFPWGHPKRADYEVALSRALDPVCWDLRLVPKPDNDP